MEEIHTKQLYLIRLEDKRGFMAREKGNNKFNEDFITENENRRVRLVVSISLISFFSILIFPVYYSIIDFESLKYQVYSLVFGAVISLIPIVLVWLRKYLFAKLFMASYDTLFILALIYFFDGRAHGSHILFLLFAIIPVFIWSIRDKVYIFIFYGINITLYILLEFIDFPFLPSEPLIAEFSSITKGILILVSYSGATISIIIFHRLSDMKERIMKRQNDEIRAQKLALERLNSDLKAKIETLTRNEAEISRSNAVKSKIYSVIAHDLRSPFSSINKLLEVIVEDFDEYTKDEIKELLKNLSKTSKNSFTLLENLLDWSRVHSSRISCQPEPLAINEIINDTLVIYQESIKLKKITIDNKIESKLLVFADKHMLSTVFRNLISNAVKFTPSLGTIAIKFRVDKKRAIAIVSISDTGIGISEDELEDLFNLEKNIIRSGTEKEKGSGLGLLICKEFVERNGGDLTVKSKENVGSEFTFSIPILLS